MWLLWHCLDTLKKKRLCGEKCVVHCVDRYVGKAWYKKGVIIDDGSKVDCVCLPKEHDKACRFIRYNVFCKLCSLVE